MAQKHDSHPSAPSTAPNLPHSPPLVTTSDQLLSSVISLLDNPRVVYAAYVPATDSTSYDVLELGRRHLVSRNKSLSFLESILPHAHVDGDSSALYAFMFTSHEGSDACLATLTALPLDGLVVSETSTFDPQGLYPCSSACAEQSSPCLICLDPPKSTPTIDSTFSAANLLPRKPLRRIYSRLVEAIRSRLIDDITEVSKDAVSGSSAHRLMNGFLLAPSRVSNEWGADWLHAATLRPLVHCQLEVHLSTSRLEVYSHFRLTDFLPLNLSLPSAAGTPITLLPFGVPAYYLSTYNGPTLAVTSQFEESLTGLGAGEWKSSPATQSEKQMAPRLITPKRMNPVYIVAWLAVQNKQGEDKGMVIIWPSRLCLSFMASSQSAHARRPLPHLPELPSQLQPSPPPPVRLPIPVALSSSEDGNIPTAPATSILTGRPISRRLCASPTSEYLRAFRCLTLSKSSKVGSVASEVSVYVESVAKEREKERERIRRERENAQTSTSPRAIATPPTTTPAPTTTSSNNPTTTFSVATGNVVMAPAPVPVTGASQPPAIAASVTNLPPPSIFYPSPPSANGKPTTKSANSTVTPTTPPLGPAQTSQPEPAPIPLSSAFDPFGSMDTSWTQPPNDFMNLGTAYDMGFDMNVDAITTSGGGGNTDAGHMNMDFEDRFTFTEDDFDFFDRPSAATRPAPPVASSLEDPSGLTPAAGPAPMGFSPSVFGDGHFSGGTPGQQHSSPFITGGGGDAFTPRFSELHTAHDLVSVGTGILPPSPSTTSNSAPATPQVKLSPECKQGPSIPSNFFEPIPFAQSHRLSDSKYDMGKFALPSPPDEEDRTEPIPLSSPVRINNWKSRYNTATDPRIGVVRKLIGVKRKSFDQGPRRHRSRPSWLQDDEEQEYPVIEDTEDVSDVASDDEDMDGDDAGVPSRATTPPPAYLPLGPTLLHMQFHHPYLLLLSKPLRPPGAAVAPMTIPVVIPTSVPTPVSPAAALGAASEKSKSLEAAGSMIAREVVENSVFADAWRTSKIHSLPYKHPGVWPADVSTLTEIIRSRPMLGGPVDLQDSLRCELGTLSESALLHRLDAPMLSVGKGDSIIQVLPSSLRFWEKLGLTPRAGKKDLTAFLFFEDDGLPKQQSAEKWLKKLSETYSACKLGTHTSGSHPICSVDGILALRLDSLRKSLIPFIADLPSEQTGLVFYIAIPAPALTLASPLLRQVLSTIKRLQKSRFEYPITFQLIPEHIIAAHDLGDSSIDFERLCFSVYHRVLQPVDRAVSRFESGQESRRYLQEPPYTLARPPNPTVRFSQLGPARTLDVLDRHTLLHVGYKFSACGKWLVASCVDQRGESYDVGSWLTQDEVETTAVLQIWDFAVQFARKANVEWRLVISKLGLMSSSELDAWIHHLSAASPLCRDLPPFQVTVLSVDQNISWSLMQHHRSSTEQQALPRRAAGKDLSKSFYMDLTTATTYTIYPTIRIPLPSPPIHKWANSSFVPDSEGASTIDTSPVLPISSTILLHAPLKRTSFAYSALHIHLLYSCKSPGSSLTISDDITHQEITRNYHELAVLASLQGPFGYSLLPLHLAALETMHDALRQEDTE